MTEEQRNDITDEKHLLAVLDSILAHLDELQAAVDGLLNPEP